MVTLPLILLQSPLCLWDLGAWGKENCKEGVGQGYLETPGVGPDICASG